MAFIRKHKDAFPQGYDYWRNEKLSLLFNEYWEDACTLRILQTGTDFILQENLLGDVLPQTDATSDDDSGRSDDIVYDPSSSSEDENVDSDEGSDCADHSEEPG